MNRSAPSQLTTQSEAASLKSSIPPGLKRIAAGSGTSDQEANNFPKQHVGMSKMFKTMGFGGGHPMQQRPMSQGAGRFQNGW